MMRARETKIPERWGHLEARWAGSLLEIFANSGYRLKAGAGLLAEILLAAGGGGDISIALSGGQRDETQHGVVSTWPTLPPPLKTVS